MDEQLINDLKELNENLRLLRVATHELYEQTRVARDSVNNVINNSHLRSTLGLLREDIGLRRLLDTNN